MTAPCRRCNGMQHDTWTARRASSSQQTKRVPVCSLTALYRLVLIVVKSCQPTALTIKRQWTRYSVIWKPNITMLRIKIFFCRVSATLLLVSCVSPWVVTNKQYVFHSKWYVVMQKIVRSMSTPKFFDLWCSQSRWRSIFLTSISIPINAGPNLTRTPRTTFLLSFCNRQIFVDFW